MESKKILEYARNESVDEGEDFLYSSGLNLGVRVMFFTITLLLILNYIYKQDNTTLWTISYSLFFGESVSRFKILKQKRYFISAAFWFILIFIHLLEYIVMIKGL